jgi:hypothetical protein
MIGAGRMNSIRRYTEMNVRRLAAFALAVGMLGGAAAYAQEAAEATAPVEGAVAATTLNGEAMATTEPVEETTISAGESPAFVAALLSVAVEELGYTEGPNNFTKYGQWAGDPNAAWCAEFICWCVDQTDQRFGYQLLDSVYPNYGGQNVGRDWFITRGRFVYRKGNCPDWGYQWLRGSDHLMTKNEYIPHPGDLVFFSYNQAGDTEHVALVEYCARDSQGNAYIHVIEGNNTSSVQRNRYPLNNSQVLGFGTCEDVADTTMRLGCSGDKVLVLQQRLTALGFLAENNQTSTYGSNTKLAVAAYQQTMENQPVTGIADRSTQQAIEAEVLQMEFDTPDTWLVAP